MTSCMRLKGEQSYLSTCDTFTITTINLLNQPESCGCIHISRIPTPRVHRLYSGLIYSAHRCGRARKLGDVHWSPGTLLTSCSICTHVTALAPGAAGALVHQQSRSVARRGPSGAAVASCRGQGSSGSAETPRVPAAYVCPTSRHLATPGRATVSWPDTSRSTPGRGRIIRSVGRPRRAPRQSSPSLMHTPWKNSHTQITSESSGRPRAASLDNGTPVRDVTHVLSVTTHLSCIGDVTPGRPADWNAP